MEKENKSGKTPSSKNPRVKNSSAMTGDAETMKSLFSFDRGIRYMNKELSYLETFPDVSDFFGDYMNGKMENSRIAKGDRIKDLFLRKKKDSEQNKAEPKSRKAHLFEKLKNLVYYKLMTGHESTILRRIKKGSVYHDRENVAQMKYSSGILSEESRSASSKGDNLFAK